MKKMLLTSASALGLMAATSMAGQPDDPGGFGRDRAAAIQNFLDDDTAPGASEWGAIASERAGQNGEINREYRENNGQTPSHGNDDDDDDSEDSTD
jgi:hypothetical protein